MNQRITSAVVDAATLAKLKQLIPSDYHEKTRIFADASLPLEQTKFLYDRMPSPGSPLEGVKFKLKPDDFEIKPTLSSVEKTLEERGARYGQFIDHAEIAQGLQDVMRKAPNWSKLDVDMRQALTVFTDKIARILNGDPYYSDSWHDLSGYATLVEKRLVALEKGE